MSAYQDFLKSKRPVTQKTGFNVEPEAINPALFHYQRDCVRWALQLGKAALFEERGLGKTIQEFEWSRQVARKTGGKTLVLAPLAVAFQMISEAAKFGYNTRYCQSQNEVSDTDIVVTNYERLQSFDAGQFAGVVLDESSLLKNFSGVMKRQIIDTFKQTPYKLAASATPAPNDHLELGNHAEFLDVMPSNEMLARWFINDTMKAGDYRLKGHAEKDFWRWLTSWAVCLSHPRDLGPEYDLPGFDLPKLNIIEHEVETSAETIRHAHAQGLLLPDSKPSSTELNRVKRQSLEKRILKAREIGDGLTPDTSLILWCDTNEEADMLSEAFPEAIEVRGSHTAKRKEEALRAFSQGEVKQIITKEKIAGRGLNWQHAHEMIFTGVNYSFEGFYQAVGRCHRFGQKESVNVHVIYAPNEANVLGVLKEKQSTFREMQGNMNEAMREHGLFRDSERLTLASSQGNVPVRFPAWLKSHNYSTQGVTR